MASILNVDKIRANGSTTDALIVNSSGQVSLPKTPYAMVNLSADVSLTPITDVPLTLLCLLKVCLGIHQPINSLFL